MGREEVQHTNPHVITDFLFLDFSFSALFLDGLTQKLFVYFSLVCAVGHVWPILEMLTICRVLSRHVL